ncbi:hypothetical protein J6590_096446, partial [Homalodisca vitripennis]
RECKLEERHVAAIIHFISNESRPVKPRYYVFAGIYGLKRFALNVPFNIKVILIKTPILPHFDYCDVVMSDMAVEQSDRLQRAH